MTRSATIHPLLTCYLSSRAACGPVATLDTGALTSPASLRCLGWTRVQRADRGEPVVQNGCKIIILNSTSAVAIAVVASLCNSSGGGGGGCRIFSKEAALSHGLHAGSSEEALASRGDGVTRCDSRLWE